MGSMLSDARKHSPMGVQVYLGGDEKQKAHIIGIMSNTISARY